MKGGERRQLEGRKRKHGTGKESRIDPCQQIARRCRTTLAKRTQGTIWAVGETALPEAECSLVKIEKVGGNGVSWPEANTKSAQKVSARKADRDDRVWHVWRGVSKNLGGPGTSCKTQEQVVFIDERRWRGRVKQARGVRSTHSTQRMNKTFTGGRS